MTIPSINSFMIFGSSISMILADKISSGLIRILFEDTISSVLIFVFVLEEVSIVKAAILFFFNLLTSEGFGIFSNKSFWFSVSKISLRLSISCNFLISFVMSKYSWRLAKPCENLSCDP